MITGHVNAARESVTRLSVQGPSGVRREVEAIIDTAYDGLLALPQAIIATLALTHLSRGNVLLADGREEVFDLYPATIFWDDQARIVEVDAIGAEALIGMALLDGYDLRIRVMEGGSVTIEPVPAIA